ncbi:BAG family molecular chaperone regulator 3 isoform X2 [Planococcus citri]|uniref:BAG family molecular chaperone regulator 3 isoform X2 n=1 Tax=Planococcus citri TaxID=170843 RepID=UPI0031F96B0D
MNQDIASDVVDGFPSFKNEDIFGKKSDPGIKSHLEDLAKKHPEFAGDLQRPLWEEPLNTNWDNAFTIPVSVEKLIADYDKPSSSQQSAPPQPETELDGQQAAAPEASNSSVESSSQETMNEHQDPKEPKRYVSKIEMTPVNPYEESTSEQGKQSQPGTPNSARKQPTVRHIPIFVEGRSEPVLPKNAAGNFQSTNQFPAQHEQTNPIKRKFDNTNEHSHQRQEVPLQSQPIPVHIEKTNKSGKSTPTPAPPTAEPEPPKQAEKPHPPPPVQKLDPMSRIEQVRNDVEELATEVEKFAGTSRTDKEYLYLDEMLTRNLIKLDLVEVEGNETLRVARKDVIRSIQKAISCLESKVPIPADQQNQDEDANQNESSADPNASMEVDDQSTQQNDPQNQNNDGGGQSK